MSSEVFLSYSHKDNQSILGDPGWVSEFHSALLTLTEENLGRQPSIWMDPEIRAYQDYQHKISSALENAELLLTILSPHFLKSAECQREVSSFLDAAREDGGVFAESGARLFKIIRNPDFDPSGLPEEFDRVLGYEFFTRDGPTGQSRILRPRIDKEEFIRRLDQLSLDIRDYLAEAANADNEHEEKNPSKKMVYLAEGSPDVGDIRLRLRTSLRQRGHRILPPQPLSKDPRIQEVEARHWLSKADLAIHLIGDAFGTALADTNKSSAELQNEVAAEVSKEKGLPRLLWIRRSATSTPDSAQAAFVRNLLLDADLLCGAELLQVPVERLRQIVEEMLRAADSKSSIQAKEMAEPEEIYLVFDTIDSTSAQLLHERLSKAGLTVSLSPVDFESSSQIRNEHRERLRRAGTVVVLRQSAETNWLRAKLQELLRWRASAQVSPGAKQRNLLFFHAAPNVPLDVPIIDIPVIDAPSKADLKPAADQLVQRLMSGEIG